jgi:hypothetical protein
MTAPRNIRLPIIIVIGLSLSGLLPFYLGQTISSASTSQVHRTFSLRGNAGLNWNRTNPGPLISVHNGDLVTILLISDDGLTHNWFTDYNNNLVVDPGEISSPTFSSTTTFLNFTFTLAIGKNAPSTGDFTYRCEFHPFSMFGTFRILPLSISVSSTQSLDSSTATTSGSLVIDTVHFNVSGSLSVIAVNTTTGATTFTKTYLISSLQMQNVSGTFTLKFLLNVAVKPYALSSDIAVKLQGAIATVSIILTRQLDINANGTVDFLDATLVASVFGSSIGSTKYNPLADFNGDGFINILDATGFASFYLAQDLR